MSLSHKPWLAVGKNAILPSQNLFSLNQESFLTIVLHLRVIAEFLFYVSHCDVDKRSEEEERIDKQTNQKALL